MAILTTKYTFAWYGVDGSDCSDVDVHDLIGRLVDGTYQGPFADRLADVEKIEIYGWENGSPKAFSWAFHKAGFDVGQGITHLKCGRMYLIKNFALLPVDVPGLVPSAEGVDMGRVVPA